MFIRYNLIKTIKLVGKGERRGGNKKAAFLIERAPSRFISLKPGRSLEHPNKISIQSTTDVSHFIESSGWPLTISNIEITVL